MSTISLCMVVRDAEKFLARCLESVGKIADEIIIADIGSSDHTREVALRYTGHVYDYPWDGDWAAAQNFSFSLATMDYLLWMDADEILEPEDAARLAGLKNSLNESIHTVAMRCRTVSDGPETPSPVYYQERLVRRDAGIRRDGLACERLLPQGNRIQADITITSRKPEAHSRLERDLQMYEKLILSGRPLSPRDRVYYAHGLAAAGRYEDAAALFEDYLASPDGEEEIKRDICIVLASCYERMADPEQRLSALLQSMAYGAPRPESCFELGRYFLENNRYSAAVFWYELALAELGDPFASD